MPELARYCACGNGKGHQGASAPFDVSGGKSFGGEQVEKIFGRVELKNMSDGSPTPSVPIPPGVNRGLCGYPGKYLADALRGMSHALPAIAGSYTPARMRVRRCIVSAVTVL